MRGQVSLYVFLSLGDILLGLVILAAGSLFVLSLVFFAGRFIACAKRKGYHSPVEQLSFFLLGIPLCLLANHVHKQQRWPEDHKIYLVVFCFVLAYVVAFFVLHLLPGKVSRRGGVRKAKFPYSFVGHFIWIGWTIAVLYVWLFGWRDFTVWGTIEQFFKIGLNACLLCFWMAHRAKSLPAEKLQEDDIRPPVFYLRSFDQEDQTFVDVPYLQRDKYSFAVNTPGVTFEQYLSGNLRECIGPFVALGNPEDYLAPEGANRLYLDDPCWQKEFIKLCHKSACILMQAGASENLKWELQTILSYAFVTKFFILTPPKRRKGVYYAFDRFMRGVINKGMGKRNATWSQFSRNLVGAGYHVDGTDPGPGTVLTFDTTGNVLLIRSNAVTPSDYVTAIQEWLCSGCQRVGMVSSLRRSRQA
jgi:hypothetical protein